MKRFFITSSLLLAIAAGSFGQSIGGLLDRIDVGIDKIKYSKLDTNFIAPPDYKLMVAIENKNFWGRNNVHAPFVWDDNEFEGFPLIEGLEKDFNKYTTNKILSKSNECTLGFRVSYSGISLGYGISLNSSGKKQSFNIGSSGNKFGFKLGFERNSLSDATFRDYRILPALYLVLYDMYEQGVLDTDKPYTVDEIVDNYDGYKKADLEGDGDDVEWQLEDIVHWYGNFYYAFNHRKFSMSAANYSQYIQKRSAGSFFVTGDFNYTRLHARDIFPLDTIHTFRDKFNSCAIALGVGYGYNWTPNKGKFLLHGSVRPTMNVFGRMSYRCYDNEGHRAPTDPDLAPLRSQQMKIRFGGMGRIAAVWNISPRFVVGSNVEITLRDNSNTKDYRMFNSRINLNAYAAMRFIRNKRH
ncbi:MAG: DUF4421 family protein [Bacteroidaceae bacterium]|nr:DUF4421 family protein [Bacteroidaceae bacterium]